MHDMIYKQNHLKKKLFVNAPSSSLTASSLIFKRGMFSIFKVSTRSS